MPILLFVFYCNVNILISVYSFSVCGATTLISFCTSALYTLTDKNLDIVSLSLDNKATQVTDRLSAGPLAFWVGILGSPYANVLCLPSEDSFQKDIKVLNGLIWVTFMKVFFFFLNCFRDDHSTLWLFF